MSERWPALDDPGFSAFWADYHRTVEAKGLNPFLSILEPLLPPPGVALDLGAGTGRHAVWLLERGWRVEAVDADPEALAALTERVPVGSPLTLQAASFEEATFPPCRLALCVFSLFFTRPESFEDVWQRLVTAIEPGGVFAGQFLGPSDEWVGTGLSVHSRAELEALLTGFEVLHFEEIDRPGQTAEGTPKHWHVFHVVARRTHAR